MQASVPYGSLKTSNRFVFYCNFFSSFYSVATNAAKEASETFSELKSCKNYCLQPLEEQVRSFKQNEFPSSEIQSAPSPCTEPISVSFNNPPPTPPPPLPGCCLSSLPLPFLLTISHGNARRICWQSAPASPGERCCRQEERDISL